MGRIQLKAVRLSFPSLFERAVFQGEEGKYQATFLIPKADTETIKLIKSEMKKLIDEAKVKVPSDKLCLTDGDEKDYEGYENHMALKASQNRRPTVVNRDRTPITENDDIIYPGCYVNAIVDFWLQNNKWGKRVNCNLYGVQFVKDGETFGTARVDVTDEFAELEENDTSSVDDFDDDDDDDDDDEF